MLDLIWVKQLALTLLTDSVNEGLNAMQVSQHLGVLSVLLYEEAMSEFVWALPISHEVR